VTRSRTSAADDVRLPWTSSPLKPSRGTAPRPFTFRRVTRPRSSPCPSSGGGSSSRRSAAQGDVADTPLMISNRQAVKSTSSAGSHRVSRGRTPARFSADRLHLARGTPRALKHGFRPGSRSRSPATCSPARGCGPPHQVQRGISSYVANPFVLSATVLLPSGPAPGARRQGWRIGCRRPRPLDLRQAR
jgi:hypothetical protein